MRPTQIGVKDAKDDTEPFGSVVAARNPRAIVPVEKRPPTSSERPEPLVEASRLDLVCFRRGYTSPYVNQGFIYPRTP